MLVFNSIIGFFVIEIDWIGVLTKKARKNMALVVTLQFGFQGAGALSLLFLRSAACLDYYSQIALSLVVASFSGGGHRPRASESGHSAFGSLLRSLSISIGDSWPKVPVSGLPPTEHLWSWNLSRRL